MQHKKLLKVLEIQLGMMYDDLYTKSHVLRTKSGIILRGISQICLVVAFILFLTADRQNYRSPNIVINIFPICRTIGWLEKRPLWSNVVGQCNLFGWLEGQDISRSCNQLVRNMITQLVTLVGVKKDKVFSMRMVMFGTEYIKAEKVLDCLLKGVSRLFDENPDFSSTIVVVHFLTEIALSECSELDGNVEEDIKYLVELCQALSRYMMYLLVNHPSLLPVSANTLEMELRRVPSVDVRKLEEIRDVWIGIIIYVAAKSRPEMHAAQLAGGGELLTFVWLLLAEYKLGDLGGVRLELTNILF
ncbi:hypothetical protein HU200_047059 [Digitaria exilis]|uniref:DUF4220 domain-containing protein n=1 Tax=Digitaria exilis TaxID=1010633 RepID=A0A835EE88_9POAL|nr:hypothetical protein HU200_047059 [Digitaria exilis]